VLYVWGSSDGSVGRAAAEGTADFIAGPYRFVEVPDGKHCITDQTPGLFASLLLNHLDLIGAER
jgi:pimeloyl-ACP methyl ester carboxylesterase